MTHTPCTPLFSRGLETCVLLLLQIVAQKKMVKPLLLKYGKYAGKSTITVGVLHCAYPLCSGEGNCVHQRTNG